MAQFFPVHSGQSFPDLLQVPKLHRIRSAAAGSRWSYALRPAATTLPELASHTATPGRKVHEAVIYSLYSPEEAGLEHTSSPSDIINGPSVRESLFRRGLPGTHNWTSSIN